MSSGIENQSTSKVEDGHFKWVTFHDVLDDAMEGGKLLPMMKRRMSNPNISTTTSSSIAMPKKTSFDFSHSFGFGEEHEIQKRRKPEKISTAMTTSCCSSMSSFEEDKYAAFSKLEKASGSAGKGWSGKVLLGSNNSASGPMGWSDEILGVSSEEEELAEQDYNNQSPVPVPQSLEVVPGEPWRHLSLHRATWDRSPNRSFIRNFP